MNKPRLTIVGLIALCAGAIGWLLFCLHRDDTPVKITQPSPLVERSSEVSTSEEGPLLLIDSAQSKAIRRIDSLDYAAARARVQPRPQERRSIGDLEEVKKITARAEIFHWVDSSLYRITPTAEQQEAMRQIDQTQPWPEGHWDDEFSCYYPDEGILTWPGEDESDASINLFTGEDRWLSGNPENMVYSPSRRYRFNGWYNNAAGWMIYTIQKQKGQKRYAHLMELSCERIMDIFWEGDSTLYIHGDIYFRRGSPERDYYGVTLE